MERSRLSFSRFREGHRWWAATRSAVHEQRPSRRQAGRRSGGAQTASLPTITTGRTSLTRTSYRQFDECGIAGAYAGSLFLQFGCTYDSMPMSTCRSSALRLTRSAGSGSTRRSRCRIGSRVSRTNLTGGAADLFGDLFLITDAADYRLALSELSGSAYANYLQSFSSLGAHYNDLIDHGSECETRALRGSALECRAGRVSIWSQLDYQWRKADGDSEAGTDEFDADHWSAWGRCQRGAIGNPRGGSGRRDQP